jgi:hypothetical protein
MLQCEGTEYLLAPKKKTPQSWSLNQRNLLPQSIDSDNLRGRLMLADDPPAATVLISLATPAGLGSSGSWAELTKRG